MSQLLNPSTSKVQDLKPLSFQKSYSLKRWNQGSYISDDNVVVIVVIVVIMITVPAIAIIIMHIHVYTHT